MNVSPKYLMKLIGQIEKQIWQEYSSYKTVFFYIKKWHVEDWNYSNFTIYFREDKNIDLTKTLHEIDGELVLKIAVDLGIETPNFIPSIPLVKLKLEENYSTAYEAFTKALEECATKPDLAVGLANATLESILKHILEDERIKVKWKKTETLYALTEALLREFSMHPSVKPPEEIRNIASSLLNISKNVEGLRSEKTLFHGKTDCDYLLEDSIYAEFIINSVAAVGLFLIGFYAKKFKSIQSREAEDLVLLENLPF